VKAAAEKVSQREMHMSQVTSAKDGFDCRRVLSPDSRTPFCVPRGGSAPLSLRRIASSFYMTRELCGVRATLRHRGG
jgi:hypothetical protein